MNFFHVPKIVIITEIDGCDAPRTALQNKKRIIIISVRLVEKNVFYGNFDLAKISKFWSEKSPLGAGSFWKCRFVQQLHRARIPSNAPLHFGGSLNPPWSWIILKPPFCTWAAPSPYTLESTPAFWGVLKSPLEPDHSETPDLYMSCTEPVYPRMHPCILGGP